MKVLIIGGTGTIGTGVIKALQKDRTNHIYVISRGKYENSSDNVVHIKGNARDYEFISEVVLSGKYDVIIDLMIWAEAEFLQRMDLFMKNCKHYIATSTSSVYGKNEGAITEDSPRVFDTTDDEELLNSHEYRIEKSRIENDIINSEYENWTIIRPAMTYGKKIPLLVYPQQIWLYRVLQNRTIVLPHEVMKNHAVFTTAEEFGDRLLCVILNKKTYREVLNIVSDSSITWEENLKICQDALSSCKFTLKVKYVSVYDMVKYVSRYPLLYDRMCDRIWNNSKFNNLCDWGGYKFDVHEDLKERIKKFAANPVFDDIDGCVWHYAYMDKVCGERTRLKEFRSRKTRIIYFLARNFSFHSTQKLISLYYKIKRKLKRLLGR